MTEYDPEVVQAVAGEGRTVYCYFSDGSIRKYDMQPHIEKGGVFLPLKEDDFFIGRLTVMNGTAAWDVSGCFDPTQCIDIDPFTLYGAAVVSDPLDVKTA